LSELQKRSQVEVSPVVQQALGKLNVRLADLMEQINVVIRVLVDENVALRINLDKLQIQQQTKEVKH
jgi:regulator of replication initiation timing